MPDVHQLAALIRDAPGLRAKRELAIVASALPAIDGDDAALISHGDDHLVLAGEAILPALVEHDPFSAGVAAVVTNVADVRAMGGRPLGLVDTLVSPDRMHAERVLEGLAWAAGLLGVDVVGGHLTLGGPPALAAFCLDGEYRGDAPYFSALRRRAPERLRDDGEALVDVAGRGLCRAARDVSMPGVAGSLLQMLELAGCGATLDLDLLPRPPAVPLERWLVTFPSFGFVLAAVPGREQEALEPFRSRGLAAAICGRFDATGILRVASSGVVADVWDLGGETLTGLRG